MLLLLLFFVSFATAQNSILFTPEDDFLPISQMQSSDMSSEDSSHFIRGVFELPLLPEPKDQYAHLDFIDLDHLKLRMDHDISRILSKIKDCYTQFFSQIKLPPKELEQHRRLLTKFILIKTLHLHCQTVIDDCGSEMFILENQVIQKITNPECSKVLTLDEDCILEDQIKIYAILYNIIEDDFFIHPLNSPPPVTAKMSSRYYESLTQVWQAKHLFMPVLGSLLIKHIAILSVQKQSFPAEINGWLDHLVNQIINDIHPKLTRDTILKILRLNKDLYEQSTCFRRLINFFEEETKKEVYRRFENAFIAYKDNHTSFFPKNEFPSDFGLRTGAIQWFHSLSKEDKKKLGLLSQKDCDFMELIIEMYQNEKKRRV